MEIFNVLCTTEQASQIMKKNTLTKGDVGKIASITSYTLVDALNDLTNAEMKEVYLVESKNVLFVMKLFIGILGEDPWVLNKIITEPSYIEMCAFIEEGSMNENEKRASFLGMTVKYLLSNGNIRNLDYNGAFQGTVPKKMFSFRQSTAEKWFDTYVIFISKIASLIYAKTADVNLVIHYVLLTSAYYLNKSQTFRYFKKSTDLSFEDTYSRILVEFIEGQDISLSERASIKGKILYKNI